MSKGQSNVETTRKVEVFRAGTFTAMNGREFAFSEADVQAMANNYDPTGAPAPVVVGHPSHDDPAFGWAESFAVNDEGVLVAEIGKLAPEFVSAVEDGRYRKISMKFYPPNAANNPSPGNYYPRHIGFLGGAAPAVSGLAPVQFAQADDADLIEIEFSEPAMEDIASLFRSVREFFIDKFSLEDADRAVPNYLIRWIDDAADEPTASPGFTQPNIEPAKEAPMSGDETQLSEREADLARRERALNTAHNVSFVDGLVEANKLLPLQKDSAVALLNQLGAGDEDEISFSDGGTEKKVPATQLFKDIMSAQPAVVPLGKTDLGDDSTSSAPAFSSPDGLAVDGDGLETHHKAVAFQAQHPGTLYLDAVQAVKGA